MHLHRWTSRSRPSGVQNVEPTADAVTTSILCHVHHRNPSGRDLVAHPPLMLKTKRTRKQQRRGKNIPSMLFSSAGTNV